MSAVQNILAASLVALRKETGFTIFAEGGEPFHNDNLYAVGGIIPGLEVRGEQDFLNLASTIEEWYKGAKALDGDHAIVGGWVHDGTLYIDLVSLFDNLEDALTVAGLWNQQAVGQINDDDDYEEFAVA